MKLIVACDGREAAPFLIALAGVTALAGTEALFAHVVDLGIEEQWAGMIGHRWLRRSPTRHEREQLTAIAGQTAQEILDEALAITDKAVKKLP